MDIELLRFPIGQYVPDRNPDQRKLDLWINDIEKFPSRIVHLVNGLTVEQLNWRYRPNGWTIKQVIHHCSDSHMNSVMRFKLTLTEDTPTIRPYQEDKWANLNDALTDEIYESIQLLSGLHKKWTRLLRSLTDKQLNLEYMHPEHGKKFNLIETIGNYAWHCNHHLAHIENAIKSMGRYN